MSKKLCNFDLTHLTLENKDERCVYCKSKMMENNYYSFNVSECGFYCCRGCDVFDDSDTRHKTGCFGCGLNLKKFAHIQDDFGSGDNCYILNPVKTPKNSEQKCFGCEKNIWSSCTQYKTMCCAYYCDACYKENCSCSSRCSNCLGNVKKSYYLENCTIVLSDKKISDEDIEEECEKCKKIYNINSSLPYYQFCAKSSKNYKNNGLYCNSCVEFSLQNIVCPHCEGSIEPNYSDVE